MSYIEDNLSPNEKILFSAKVSVAVFIPSIVVFLLSVVLVIFSLSNSTGRSSVDASAPLSFLGAIILFLYFIGLLIQAITMLLTTEFGVTNRRVIAKVGFIRRHTLEILLPKIESIAVHQDILGRIFDFGLITVTGTGGTKESFRAISGPVVVRKNINKILESNTQAYEQQPR